MIDDTKTEEWVEKQNERTAAYVKKTRERQPDRDSAKDFWGTDHRIPTVCAMDGFLYNILPTEWRRTTMEEYAKDKPDWETVLNLEDLSKEKGVHMELKDPLFCEENPQRVLLRFYPDGGEESVHFEFDIGTKTFVEDRPFSLPDPSHTLLDWISADTVIVEDGMSPDARTKAGRAGRARLWQRGVDVMDAPILWSCESDTIDVELHVSGEPGSKRVLIQDCKPGYDEEKYLFALPTPLDAEAMKKSKTQINIPKDAAEKLVGQHIVIQLFSDWYRDDGASFKQGSLIASKLADLVDDNPVFQTIYQPDGDSCMSRLTFVENYTWVGHNSMVIKGITKGRERLHILRSSEGGVEMKQIEELPEDATFEVTSLHHLDDRNRDSFLVLVNSCTRPTTLRRVTLDGKLSAFGNDRTICDAEEYQASYFETRSENGLVRYIEFRQRGTDDGTPRQVFYEGYGGFEWTHLPMDISWADSWLRQGKVLVIGMLTGDGYYGFERADLGKVEGNARTNKDSLAIFDDLIARGATTGSRICATGSSKGGTHVANMLTDHGDKVGCVIMRYTATDMLNFHTIGSAIGELWFKEVGNPEENPELLRSRSPLHKLEPNRSCPPAMIISAANDTLAPPAHGRMFHARLRELNQDSFYMEPKTGGHGYQTHAQWAERMTAEFTFADDKLEPNASSDAGPAEAATSNLVVKP